MLPGAEPPDARTCPRYGAPDLTQSVRDARGRVGFALRRPVRPRHGKPVVCLSICPPPHGGQPCPPLWRHKRSLPDFPASLAAGGRRETREPQSQRAKSVSQQPVPKGMGLREAPGYRPAAGTPLCKAARVSFRGAGCRCGRPPVLSAGGRPWSPPWPPLSAWPPRPLHAGPSKAPRMGAHAPRLTPASVGAGSVGAGSLHTAAAADPVLRLRQLLLDGAPCPPAGAVVRVGATG